MEDLESSLSEVKYSLVWVLCPPVFIFFLLKDALNAFNRKAHWLPGQSLVLTSLTIQLLSLLGQLDVDVDVDADLYVPLTNRGRVLLCVFIGYLLPGMMRSRFTDMSSNIRALALSVTGQIVFEVSFALKVKKIEHSRSPSPYPSPSPSPSPSGLLPVNWGKSQFTWLVVSQAILFTAIILLVFLLICAVLAGKSIRNINSRNVSLALSCGCNSAVDHTLPSSSIRDHVLKCWIVVRASQPDYIMARSVFSSFVGLVVTLCVVFLVVEAMVEAKSQPLVWPVLFFSIQWAFIVIGWILILFRWLSGVMYFPRDLQSLFHCEDFWTRSIVELKADRDARFREQLFRGKRPLERATQKSCIVFLIVSFRLYSLLLTMALCLQKIMVSLSKICWCLSEIAFRLIRPVIFSREKNVLLSGSNISPTDEIPFLKYKEALEIMTMPGEIAFSLWIANEKAFKKVEKQMEEGSKKGKDSSQLIKLKEHKTGDPHDESAISVEEEEYFQQISKMSWKMKAVSLIRFMIYYYEDDTNFDIVNDAIKAYSQAWTLMNIVDTSDPEANLTSLDADKEFDALEAIWNENPKHCHFKEHLSYKKDLDKFSKDGCLKLFSAEEEARAKNEENFKDRSYESEEWMKKAAAKIRFYKTLKKLDLKTDHSMEKLRCLLANVIVNCIQTKVDNALIENSTKWVKERKTTSSS